ncbi:hypothetical protein [Sorangium atrum]|uniref:Uncharacterized protein n=1 Tax=Sorangium atrum TaxID=2995308 RepID=A0ABT5CBX5_9BACT|nr:hypothetical protein [Sorangium aterium]MDC0682627.1 hypothetical protein [Sorangium aterium]
MSSEGRYILWNYMLAEHCLLAHSCEGIVLLTVAPRTLAAALEEAGEGGRSPEEAEADFTAAVAGMYRHRVLSSAKKLRALKSTSPNDVPFGIGFLALSVLAAFHMRTDDEHTGRAFYPRLAEMLGCDLARSYPVGFEGDAFIDLWDELAAWLKVHYGRELAAPDAVGVRRYVAYPFAHVPLRQVDIERLPQFFDAYGYEPGARAPLDRLTYDLYEASGPWRHLTESGQNALKDRHRRPFVVRQVAHELERWDGCRVDSSGARTATIELWMDIRRRRAQLHLLARRPSGFPELIEDRELVFASSQDGWYEPVQLGRDDGQLLENGVRIGTRSNNGGRYYLQLRRARVLPLTPSEEYTGFVSDRVLRADTDCAVLCAEPLVDDVARYLQALSHERVRPRRDDTIPTGWCLFTDVRATNECSPPPGLERLGVETSLALIPEGGLRLGRRWSWLESAPARLTVLGSHRGLVAKVDGQEVRLDDGGRVHTDLLGAAGQHVIEIGNRLRQRVTVLKGAVHTDCRSWLGPDIDQPIPVAVPAGHWVLLGAGPGESESIFAPSEGALVRPSFQVRWAVRVASGPGAKALHIHDHILSRPAPRPGAPARGKKSGASWADTVYQAGIRRPDFLCQHGCRDERLSAEWRQLMEAARSSKRAGRRRR